MQAKTLSAFQSRKHLFLGLNILLILWCLTQIIIYSVQVSKVPCPEVQHLGIGYIINYVLYMLVPIFSILACYKCNIAGINMVYSAMNIVIKIVSIVVVMTVAWRHVGMCFIHNKLKTIIICCSSMEMLMLICQIVLMNRRRLQLQRNKSQQTDSSAKAILDSSRVNNNI